MFYSFFRWLKASHSPRLNSGWAKSTRLYLEGLERREAPAANVFVVPASVPTDATHFTSLASALQAAGANGTVTLLAGSTPDTGTVNITQAGVTIQSDTALSAYFAAQENLNISAQGVVLRNLNLGSVTIGEGITGIQILNSTVDTITRAGGGNGSGSIPSSASDTSVLAFSRTIIAFNRILGTVTLTGNGAASSSHDIIVNNVFTGTGTVTGSGMTAAMLNLSDESGAVIQSNRFGNGGTFGPDGALGQKAGAFSDPRAISILAPLPGTASPRSAISITGTANTSSNGILVQGNTITVNGANASTFGIGITAATQQMGIRIENNSVGTGQGTGLLITTGNDQATHVAIQGNDFSGNAVGVQYNGANSSTVGLDLGGGSLGSTGNNVFTSFTSAASATNAAIALNNVAATAQLSAVGNVFGVSNPSSVIFGGNNADVSSALTGSLAFIQSIYISALGRPGTMAELEAWNGVFNQRNALDQTGRMTVINGLLNSQEAIIRMVNLIYVDCLGRTVDTLGAVYWSGIAASTGSLEQVIAGIVSSVEWQQKNPGVPVEVYYENQLHRPAVSESEWTFWQQIQMTNGLEAVPLGITASPEFRQGFALNVMLQQLHVQTPPAELPTLVSNNSLNLLQLQASLFDLLSFHSDQQSVPK